MAAEAGFSLYEELAHWYRLFDPVEDHHDEAECYRSAFGGAIDGVGRTLLELGAGAGHNAWHLKAGFDCTLSDISEPMLELSRELNPSCTHVSGDMRALRLDQSFDAVLVHDAIAYMSSEGDLRSAIETAFLHTRPGGAAIFAPDCLRETFVEQSRSYFAAEQGRSLRCIEWSWDPDPVDDSCVVDYAFLLRDDSGVRAVHDRHIEGLFSRAVWRALLGSAGFEVAMLSRPLDADAITDGYTPEVFLCQRPR